MVEIVLYALGTLILFFVIVSIILLIKEDRELKINPIPKLKNSDRDFADIDSKYCHKIFEVKRGR